ncbi:MAG: hypothetical protein RLZZ385_545 [Pseudomonadota bacterium]|jgi:universal stress protein E
MKNLRRIMVVIDPTVERDFVTDRVRNIIDADRRERALTGGSGDGGSEHPAIELRFFINSANTLNQQSHAYEGMGAAFIEKQRQLYVEHYNKILTALLEEFTAADVIASSAFTEEPDLSDAIIHQVREYQPGLVLKSTHQHSVLQRTLITNTDWRLIRKCPAPLLLVKHRDWIEHGSVVASVDPLHAKAEQSRLDHALIRSAEQIAERFHQTARVFHCYFPFVSTMFPSALETREQTESIQRQHEEKMQELLASHHIDPSHVEMSRGELVPALINFLEKCSANVLVIGALSRNFLERAIVGSTAEKILDDCPCDILVIKP